MTMLVILLIIGVVIYLAMRGKQDRPEQLGAPRRGLPTGPLEPHTFACPYPKCPACGASGDRMKQQWDGLRSVKWTCGYCGALAGLQTLKDEDLPPSARRQLGLDAPMHQGDGWTGGASDNSSSSDWGESSSGSSDWGDSGGDFGGGDSGGDW